MNVKIMKTAKPALTRPPTRSVTLFEFAKNAAAPSAASPAVWTASSALSESEAPVFWSCSTYSGIFSLSARAPSAICGMIAYAKKSRIAPIRRNAQAVDFPRPMPRRWKIRTSGSIENARKPAATSQTIVSRTSQSPMSRAMTARITANTIRAVEAKKRRFGRPFGTVGSEGDGETAGELMRGSNSPSEVEFLARSRDARTFGSPGAKMSRSAEDGRVRSLE